MSRVGIDIGGTKIAVGLCDDAGRLLASRRLLVAEIRDLCDEIRNTLEILRREAGNAGKVTFCGVGIPGTVSGDGRRIVKAPNIAILPETVIDDLEAALGIPCRLVQDSRAAAWGEYKAGAGRGMQAVICVTLGTGIGTGIVLDGRIYAGALGCAGEMGHLPAVENGRTCGCGKRGCVEKYAAELLGEGKTLADLFAAAKAGDTRAADAIDEAVVIIGRALVAEINLLSPDCLLFSGGLAQREEYLAPLMEYVRMHCYSAGQLPKIDKAELGEYAPLIGAAMLEL